MFKKAFNYLVELIKEEYKFIIFLILLFIVLNYPLNYYIVMGGGIDDVSSRIEVADKNDSKGSFNISYVTQVDANPLFYGLSYIIPTWERQSADNYKYTIEENLEDIQFRSDIDLITANGNATYWAYTLADKKVEEKSAKLYVIATYPEEYPSSLKVGDEILEVDGIHRNSTDEYIEYLQTKEVGDKVEIRINRKTKEQVVTTEIHESLDEEEKGRKVVGILLQYVREFETDPKVEIQFHRNESGPSGGLITTLEIYNQLTKKDLTKGYTIAGTGTIEADGSIGQIGGIEHKILGAVSAKADIFISPGGNNYEQAKAYIKEKNLKIKLIKVDTIQEAIEKLEGLD